MTPNSNTANFNFFFLNYNLGDHRLALNLELLNSASPRCNCDNLPGIDMFPGWLNIDGNLSCFRCANVDDR